MCTLRKCSILLVLAVALTALLSVTSLAQPQGAVSELTDLRTATSKTWLDSDGSRTAEISVAPVHYKDENDVWQDIDTTIGAAAKAGFGHSVIKNRFKTHLAASANGWQEVELDDVTFSFAAKSGVGRGSVDGSTITYADAWPDVDLKYQVLPSGLKEDIILKEQPEVSEFRFTVNPGGLKPVTAGRGIDFVDSNGVAHVTIPGPFMSDANGEFSEAVEAAWEELPDGTVELVLQPDEAWLAQASYPVVIDPSVTIYSSDGDGKDGYFTEIEGVWNYSAIYLAMILNSHRKVACVQFDLEDLPRNAVVTGTPTISLYAYSGLGASRYVYMKRNLESWPQDSLPDAGSTIATVAWSGAAGYKSFSGTDVTDMIQKWAWLEYDNYGVSFYPSSSYEMRCWSRENPGGWPKLIVTYDLDETAPTPGTATSPTYDNSSPIVVSYSGATDTGDYQSGLKLVELWYKKGYNGTWTNSGLSKTAASDSFNFTGMTDADTYYFDLVAEDYAGNRSATPTGDGDCWTVYVSGGSEVSTDGSVFVTREYLYPGGPVKRTTVYDEDGEKFRQVSCNYGPEEEVLSYSGDTEESSVTYDSLYRTKTLTDPNDEVTAYTYDMLGNLTQIDLPGDETIQFPDHDASGRVTRSIDNKGQEITYVYDYDPQNLLTEVNYTNNSSYDKTFTYDDVFGRCMSASDGEGITEYTYDDIGLVTSVETDYTSLPARTVSYTFYDDGSLHTMVTPAGTFSYSYDAGCRMTGLTNPESQAFSWSYLDNNLLQTQELPVAVTTYDYNARGLMTGLANRKLDETLLTQFGVSTAMSYDAIGNLLSVTASVPSVQALSGTTDYTYNALSQLTLEDSTRNSGFEYTFAYDDAGNPTTFKGATHTFDGVLNQRTGESFVYDDNGNPTTYKGTSGFTYDPNNHLTTIPNELTMGYHQGLRAWKDDGTDRTYYLYSGATPVCEMDEDGDVIAVNTFGANGLVARQDGETTVYYTFDEGGNVAQTIESDGDVLSTELYDSYGNRLTITGTNDTPYGYGAQHGYYTDRETGLVLATYRYYDPTEGRWLTRDPIGYAGGLNLYGYCGGNPVNGIDPLGLRSWYDGLLNGDWGRRIPILGDAWYDWGYAMGLREGGKASTADVIGKGASAIIQTVGFAVIAVGAGELIIAGGQTVVALVTGGGGAAAATKVPQIITNHANGMAFQDAVFNAKGLTANTQYVVGKVSGGGYQLTIPDSLTGGITEIKNVGYQSLVPQLQAQINVAQYSGQSYTLVVNMNTTCSKPLENTIIEVGGTITRFDPVTGSFQSYFP